MSNVRYPPRPERPPSCHCPAYVQRRRHCPGPAQSCCLRCRCSHPHRPSRRRRNSSSSHAWPRPMRMPRGSVACKVTGKAVGTLVRRRRSPPAGCVLPLVCAWGSCLRVYVLAKLEVLESHAIIGLPSGVAQCPKHAVGRLAGALWIVIAVELLPSCQVVVCNWKEINDLLALIFHLLPHWNRTKCDLYQLRDPNEAQRLWPVGAHNKLRCM